MRLLVGGLLLVAGVACANAHTAPSAQGGSAQSQDAVVAEVAGRKITMKELDDRWQSLDPAERARVTQLVYQNRRNVLDQIVGDALIEQAAKDAGVPVDQYTTQETAKRVTPVTEAEVQQFFEENKDRAQGRTVEQLGDSIRGFLAGNRQQQARAQLIDDLKKKAPATRVYLDPPRQVVEVAADDPSIGPATAPVTIVEFSDYQ